LPEYSGSLPVAELTRALWLAPMLPLFAAAVCALWRAEASRRAVVALGAVAATLAILLWKALELAGRDVISGSLLELPWTLVRIGSLDVSFGLELGAAAAVVAIAASSAALAALAHARRAATGCELAGMCLALGSFLLVLLGHDLVIVVFGWQGLALAGYLLRAPLLGSPDARGAWVGAALGSLSGASLLAGAALLFWALGGVWTGDGDYVPGFHSRLVAVGQLGAKSTDRLQPTSQREARGSLTLTALPGATIRLGGADLCALDERGEPGGLGTPTRPCKQPAETPFVRLPLAAAIHDVRVALGPGTNELLVEKVRILKGTETRIVLAGSSLSLREISEQLAIRDLSGAPALRVALLKKQLWGFPVLGIVGVLFLLAALVRAGTPPFHARLSQPGSASAGGAALLAGLGLGSAAVLIARLSFLLALVPRLVSVLALVAALGAVYLAARAAHQRELRAALTLAIAAQLVLAIAFAALGASSAAAVHVAVLALAAVALFCARAPSDRAYFLGSAAAAAAPIPALGAFWSRDAGLWSAFVTSESALVPGWVTYAFGSIASGLIAFALWRHHFGAAKPREPAADRAPLIAGALGLALGLVLVPLGHPAQEPPGEWLFGAAAERVPSDPSLRLGLLLVTFAIALAGFLLARRRPDVDALPGARLLSREPEPSASLAIGRAVQRLGQALIAVDRAVVRLFGGAAEPEAEPAPERELAPESSPAPKTTNKRRRARGGP
jgi:NADH:ubiquinone oxidoreductase subunit 5 (subunit L)/multisubunit Na+/H+ antiporter MnhA subunit